MCFIKTKTPKISKKVSDPVVRHQADASVTKTTGDSAGGYRENIKTSVIGLSDDITTNKKTLLGE